MIRYSLLALVLATAPVFAQDKAKIAKQDSNALAKLAQSDMAEIEAGKVAAQKASNPEVKKYGQHMVDEHSKMLEEGKKLAESKGVKPPAQTDSKHQAALKKLQGLSGEEFDRAYMKQMVQDHEEALRLAQTTAKNSKDPEVKAHAEKGAPHIQEHLDQAKKLAQAGQSSKSDSSSKSGQSSATKSGQSSK
jgi:putative membrane protein